MKGLCFQLYSSNSREARERLRGSEHWFCLPQDLDCALSAWWSTIILTQSMHLTPPGLLRHQAHTQMHLYTCTQNTYTNQIKYILKVY